jgi:hypothetical protein
MQQPMRSQFTNLCNHLKSRPGDKQFMLDVISTLCDGNHEYFQKDYIAPKRVPFKELIQINNEDGFFTGLPASQSKSKHNGPIRIMMTQ